MPLWVTGQEEGVRRLISVKKVKKMPDINYSYTLSILRFLKMHLKGQKEIHQNVDLGYNRVTRS